METINSLVTALFTLALKPLAGVDAVWSVVAVSIVAGVVLALAYGKLSNQNGLKRVKRYITSGMYESVIFRHDLRLSLGAQARMLLGGLRYVALAIPPILILLIPSILILAQLNSRFGYRPLNPGEKTVVTLKAISDDLLFESELKSSVGLEISPPVRDLDQRSVTWRIDTPTTLSPKAAQLFELSVAGETSAQPIYIGDRPALIATLTSRSFFDQLLYPGSALPSNLAKDIESISVEYPQAALSLAGLNTNWLALFALISITSGLVASRVFGIEV